jgi:hypothetical protein
MTLPPDPHGPTDPADDGGLRPYLGVLLVALVIAVGLAVYVLGYRDEILAILTQSPT